MFQTRLDGNNEAKMMKMREIIEASWDKDCRQI